MSIVSVAVDEASSSFIHVDDMLGGFGGDELGTGRHSCLARLYTADLEKTEIAYSEQGTIRKTDAKHGGLWSQGQPTWSFERKKESNDCHGEPRKGDVRQAARHSGLGGEKVTECNLET